MVSESSPLLAEQLPGNETPRDCDVANTQTSRLSDTGSSISGIVRLVIQHVIKYKVLYIIGLFAFIIDVSFMMMIAPMSRLSELGICRKYYLIADPSVIDLNGDIPEMLCKIDLIQAELAKLSGVLTMLMMAPTLFFSVPFGILADRIGRKVVCTLGVIGLTLGFFWYFLVFRFYTIFPLAAVYAFPLFFIIGGGGSVVAALIMAMISDVTPRDIRARVYFLIHTVVVASALVGPPIGSILLEKLGPSQAFFWTLPPRLFSLVLLYLVPETKNIAVESSSASNLDAMDLTTAQRSFKSRVDEGIRHFIHHFKQDIVPLISRKPVLLGMISLVVNTFTVPVTGIIVQYLSVKFMWKFAKASYAVSFMSGTQIVLLCTVIPSVDNYLKRRYKSPEQANLVLSRGSIFFLVVGMLFVGLAPDAISVFSGLFLYTCGSGYLPALRSFMTSLVSRDDTALLFTLIGVFDSVGAMFGAPILAWTFAAGIKTGGLALGLPFFCAAAIYALSGVSIWSLSPPAHNHREDSDSDEESLRADEPLL